MPAVKENIDLAKLPKHIAIIMDGNGRWAKQSGKPRLFGHHNGVKSVREVSEACAELGVKNLTLYAFSTENWNRPITEVQGLMGLLVETVRSEVKTLMENNIRLMAIGDLKKLPERTFKALEEGMEHTRNNDRMNLILALNYSARWEILEAANQLAREAVDGKISLPIEEPDFATLLATKDIPDPELLIRTSGEQRISNFLLWQLAYTELYFTETLWPDFRKPDLYKAIIDYQTRERRFGLTSEQITV
jgi:undecaprenyl diphosphate synthase